MIMILTYANSGILALLLIAGGWVKIRNYFHDKAREKAEALAAIQKSKEDEIEAAVQERLSKMNLQQPTPTSATE
ncbi:DUF1378 family protein [Enterobacter cancerogenus]